MVKRSVLELEPAADDADLASPLHELEEAVERSFGDARVRVEREYALPAAEPDCAVVRHCEAGILLLRDQADVREFISHERAGARVLSTTKIVIGTRGAWYCSESRQSRRSSRDR
jgi:hypothetical protein